MPIKNDLILKAARGEKTDRIPVWVMRQAGRILPEYRKVRASVSGFKELVETPELAAEVTLQPVNILGVDAAIIFSDILVVPEAMGLTYEMIESKGPNFPVTIKSEKDFALLRKVDSEKHLKYVLDAIKIVKRELDETIPLIGFAGAPFTIFAYMIEGHGSKTFSKARRALYTQPDFSHQLLQLITDATIDYLKAQIKVGADMVQLFDSWAGILGKEQYQTFGIRYINQICNAINEVPITVFAKGAYFAMDDFKQTACNTIGLDWGMNIASCRKIFGNTKTLQGNLDPCLLYADKETIKKETIKMLKNFGNQRYIANLGHGVYPDTNPENVKLFIETVKEFKTN
jgi:uroporphyrinogen decarboxylase